MRNVTGGLTRADVVNRPAVTYVVLCTKEAGVPRSARSRGTSLLVGLLRRRSRRTLFLRRICRPVPLRVDRPFLRLCCTWRLVSGRLMLKTVFGLLNACG